VRLWGYWRLMPWRWPRLTSVKDVSPRGFRVYRAVSLGRMVLWFPWWCLYSEVDDAR
jgi:hypothetical protein